MGACFKFYDCAYSNNLRFVVRLYVIRELFGVLNSHFLCLSLNKGTSQDLFIIGAKNKITVEAYVKLLLQMDVSRFRLANPLPHSFSFVNLFTL